MRQTKATSPHFMEEKIKIERKEGTPLKAHSSSGSQAPAMVIPSLRLFPTHLTLLADVLAAS